ncbi:MAG: hypothetical protein HRT47_08740 [Candidatus Caenarcaniphilales bacterium]|nr:hypothetical protein [Candidatus Caenarcaniphilales bacterium]
METNNVNFNTLNLLNQGLKQVPNKNYVPTYGLTSEQARNLGKQSLKDPVIGEVNEI